MSSSLLLQQCPACLVYLTLMVLQMRGEWPYSCCFQSVLSTSMWCIHTAVLTQLLLGRNKTLNQKKSSGTIQPVVNGRDKRVRIFLKSISSKVNAIVQLEFETAFFSITA